MGGGGTEELNSHSERNQQGFMVMLAVKIKNRGIKLEYSIQWHAQGFAANFDQEGVMQTTRRVDLIVRGLDTDFFKNNPR